MQHPGTFFAALVIAFAASPAVAQGPTPNGWADVFHGRLGKDALARDVNAACQLASARDGYHAFVTWAAA